MLAIVVTKVVASSLMVSSVCSVARVSVDITYGRDYPKLSAMSAELSGSKAELARLQALLQASATTLFVTYSRYLRRFVVVSVDDVKFM